MKAAVQSILICGPDCPFEHSHSHGSTAHRCAVVRALLDFTPTKFSRSPTAPSREKKPSLRTHVYCFTNSPDCTALVGLLALPVTSLSSLPRGLTHIQKIFFCNLTAGVIPFSLDEITSNPTAGYSRSRSRGLGVSSSKRTRYSWSRRISTVSGYYIVIELPNPVIGTTAVRKYCTIPDCKTLLGCDMRTHVIRTRCRSDA